MNEDMQKRIANQIPRILQAFHHNKGAHGCILGGSLCDCDGWAYRNELDTICGNHTGRISDLRGRGYDIECHKKNTPNPLYHNLGKKLMQVEGKLMREVKFGHLPISGGWDISQLVRV